MGASQLTPNPTSSIPKFQPDTEKIKHHLLTHGVNPTPKIIHTLRKKQLQKHTRKQNKKETQNSSLTPSQQQQISEETHFLALKNEYKHFNNLLRERNQKGSGNNGGGGGLGFSGRPWENIERVKLRELASGVGGGGGGGGTGYEVGKLRRESLVELGKLFEERSRDEEVNLRWVLDDDVELEGGLVEDEGFKEGFRKRTRTEDAEIKFLVARLGAKEINRRDWKFSRMMKLSGLQFTEAQLLKIVKGLGNNGHWKQALSVVECVYSDKERKHWKSRFVYTKLLAVLGKARRPHEALRVFYQMREDFYLYPDMATYHSIAVTLGQSGLVKELINIIEVMREKPSKKIKNARRKDWDPVLHPDLVVYNAVLNASIPSQQWKSVFWVFEQLRKNGLKPNGATYGLAMEVMLHSGKYDLVHEFFRKMKRSGEAPRAITYRVLVQTFWEEGKADEAVEAVRDMERRGVVGNACVYYELARCLCSKGRWQEAMLEVERLRKTPEAKPLGVTFTGLIISSMEGGHVDNCISIFNFLEKLSAPNIGTINAMLKVFGRNDMFSKARELFEELKGGRFHLTTDDKGKFSSTLVVPDGYTYSIMLDASAIALQWEYFEYLYKEMILSGYQLDQSKHGALLVTASRAGKGHLLEHAFDTILEAGEIPQPPIFLEMVSQATVQHQYERAVNLVSAMAHASFQVSEKQWIDLFVNYVGRISKDCLQNLWVALGNCNVVSEPTVKNLLSSLRYLNENHLSREILNSTNALVCDTAGMNQGQYQEMDSSQKLIQGKASTSMLCETLDWDETQNVNHTDYTSLSTDDSGSHVQGDCKLKVDRLNLFSDEECTLGGMVDGENVGRDKILLSFNLDGSLKEIDEVELNEAFDEAEEFGDKIPSAYEILEIWKERRQKDGILFPFHMGQKQV